MMAMRIGPAPPELAGAESAGGKELAKALAFYKAKKNRKKSFPFAAYKKKSVVEALNRQFHYKCAYCESFFGATAPVDVEHYRPKGGVEVDGKLAKPGYYWLAAEWTNLLPSCIDCNRARTHPFDDEPELRGKANRFPIANPARRAARPGEERREKRLLLNPYLDRPEQHLRFQPDGSVQPRADRRGRESPMGKASIQVYGLDRPLLSQARRDFLIEVQGAMAQIRIAMDALDQAPAGAARQALERLLELEIQALKTKIDRPRPYCGVAAQIVGDFLARLGR